MPAHWDDLKTVMHLVRQGSLATAGESLEVSYTTVARRIKRAEDDLGLRLFERLADGYQPTDAGRMVAEKAAAMESQEHDLMRHLDASDRTLRGTLTLTAPQMVFSEFLAPVLGEFSALYPDVQLQLLGSVTMLDLNRREADLAIRISNDPGDSLVGRRMTGQQSAFFGTQDLVDTLHNDPTARVKWIGFQSNAQVPQYVSEIFPNVHTGIVADDYVTLIGVLKQGAGISQLPMVVGRTTPGLVRIEPLASRPFSDVWMVSHRDVWASAKVAAFRELATPYFLKNRHMFVE